MPEPASRPSSAAAACSAGAAAIPAAAVVATAASRPGSAAAATVKPAAGQEGAGVLLTWLGPSCFRLEKDGFVAVIDQGIVAPASALDDDADGVLITHQHADHFLPSLIAGRLKTRPGTTRSWTNKDVAALLDGSRGHGARDRPG